MLTELKFLMRCSCGQRCWIPGARHSLPENLKFGTSYRCPKCDAPLGAANFMPGQEKTIARVKQREREQALTDIDEENARRRTP
jgi:hypothetical protein